MAAKLTVVPPGATAKPKTPKSITEALEGTSRDVLAAMRKALAKQLDEGLVSSNSIASAYKELRELDRLIRSLDAAAKDAHGDDDREAGDETFDVSAV